MPDTAGLLEAARILVKEGFQVMAYTSDDIKSLLVTHGPLWAAGNWYGVGHAIVITGIDGETVHLNDPDGGVKKTGLVNWFNTMRFRTWPDALLAKDPARY